MEPIEIKAGPSLYLIQQSLFYHPECGEECDMGHETTVPHSHCFPVRFTTAEGTIFWVDIELARRFCSEWNLVGDVRWIQSRDTTRRGTPSYLIRIHIKYNPAKRTGWCCLVVPADSATDPENFLNRITDVLEPWVQGPSGRPQPRV